MFFLAPPPGPPLVARNFDLRRVEVQEVLRVVTTKPTMQADDHVTPPASPISAVSPACSPASVLGKRSREDEDVSPDVTHASGGSPPKQPKNVHCKFCNGEKHYYKTCPKRACSSCNEMGHHERKCPTVPYTKKQKTSVTTVVPAPSKETLDFTPDMARQLFGLVTADQLRPLVIARINTMSKDELERVYLRLV